MNTFPLVYEYNHIHPYSHNFSFRPLNLFLILGFPQRLENLEHLENKNGYGKVMEHAKFAKSH